MISPEQRADIELVLGLIALDLRRVPIAHKQRLDLALMRFNLSGSSDRKLMGCFAELGSCYQSSQMTAEWRAGKHGLDVQAQLKIAGSNPYNIQSLARYARQAAEHCNGADGDALVRELSRKLLASTSRQRWEGPEPEQGGKDGLEPDPAPKPAPEAVPPSEEEDFGDPELDALLERRARERQSPVEPTSQIQADERHAKRSRPDSGEWQASLEYNKRASHIRTVYSFDPDTRKQFKDVAAFIAELQRRLGGRDPCDPHVSREDRGRAVGKTYAELLEIKRRASAYRRRKGWPGKVKLTTIGPCDLTPDQEKKLYNAERARQRKTRRTEKQEAKMTMEQIGTITGATYSAVMEAQKARTRGRGETILQALRGGGELTVEQLMDALGRHPLWQEYVGLGKSRFRRGVIDRLDDLKAVGRIAQRHERHGRNMLRIVWIADAPTRD